MENLQENADPGTARRAAVRQVERKLGFLVHLAAYLLLNGGLIMLNLLTAAHRPWSLGPLLGWGVGLLFHAGAVFLLAPGAAWKARMIERELDRLRATNHTTKA